MDLVKRLYDFRALDIPAQMFQLSWSAGEVERALEDVRTRFLTIEETAGPLQAEDFAVFDLPEAGERKAKRVQINVGKGFYDAAFEESLPGLTPGAAVSMPRRDQGRQGTLVQIKRRVIPPLSDSLIPRMGMAGVETVEDYRQWEVKRLLAQERKKKSNAIFAMVMREVCKRSEFADLTGETERRFRDNAAGFRTAAAEQNRTYEEFLADFVPPAYETLERREAYLRSEAADQVRVLAVGQAYLKQIGRVLDRDSYEQYKQELIAGGISPDAVEPCEAYLTHYPLMIYDEDVLEYFGPRFEEVERP